MEQWKEHYTNLLVEHRTEFEIKTRHIQVEEESISPVDLTELKSALKIMKNNKSPGPGDIPIELLKQAPDVLLEIVVTLINKCLIEGNNIPEEWNLSYISSIYKKGNKKLCGNYRGLSVTSSMERLYGRVLKNRIEGHIKDFEEQSGFRAGRSCIDNTFVLNQLIEKRKARNLNTYLVFVDLEKAYDNVPLNKLFDVLEASELNKAYTKAIYNIYKNSKASIKVGNNYSEPFQTTKGLKQGCCLSPTLFKIYAQQALNNWTRKCSKMGVEIGEYCLYTLLFADDQVVIASDQEDVEYMTRKLTEEYSKWGLNMNLGKTEFLEVGGNLTTDLQLGSGKVRGVKEYKYLGSVISQEGNTKKDIQNRIVQGRKAIQLLNSLLWSTRIKMKTKIMLYYAIVEPILSYGSECWQLTSQEKNKILTVEMDFLRRSCRISRSDHIRNDEIRQRTKVTETVIDRIEYKQLMWYGHVKRMENERWPRRIMEYIPSNRRRRGRPAASWENNMEIAMRNRDIEKNEWMDRKRWRIKCGMRPRS